MKTFKSVNPSIDILLFNMKTFKSVNPSIDILLFNMKTFQPVKWNYLFFPIAQINSSAFKGGFSSAVSMAMFSPNGSLLCAVGADGEAGNGTNDQWTNDQLIITNPIPQELFLGWQELFKAWFEYSKILSILNVDQLARDPLSHPWGAIIVKDPSAEARLWEADGSKEQLLCLKGHHDVATFVTFSPDGQFLDIAAGSGDGEAQDFRLVMACPTKTRLNIATFGTCWLAELADWYVFLLIPRLSMSCSLMVP